MDVEQQAVAAARSTGQPDCRVDRDIVALRRTAAGSHTLASAVRFDALHEDTLRTAAQHQRVGGARRPRAAACFHDAVERSGDESAAEDDVAALERNYETAGRAGGIHLAFGFGDVFGGLPMARRGDEILEDPW